MISKEETELERLKRIDRNLRIAERVALKELLNRGYTRSEIQKMLDDKPKIQP